jgi:hypothetical protein
MLLYVRSSFPLYPSKIYLHLTFLCFLSFRSGASTYHRTEQGSYRQAKPHIYVLHSCLLQLGKCINVQICSLARPSEAANLCSWSSQPQFTLLCGQCALAKILLYESCNKDIRSSGPLFKGTDCSRLPDIIYKKVS